MRALALLLALFALPGCQSAPASDLTTPEGVIAQYFAAVEDGDRAAALALGTEEWAEREAAWEQGFTTAFFDEGLGVDSWEAVSLEGQAEFAEVLVRVRAVLLTPDGEKDNEGMRFRLREEGGRWWIIDLR